VKTVAEMNHFREKDLKNHFNTEINGEADAPIEENLPDEQTRKDFQLMRALDLLKGWTIFQSMQAA